jgi:hypothetical protein
VSALSHMAPSIAHFVSPEMGLIDTSRRLGPVAPVRYRAVVTVLWMEPIIDVAMKIGRTVKPRAGADEYTAAKPFWSVIAGWRTTIWSNVVVSVGAVRSDADIDTDLSLSDRDS